MPCMPSLPGARASWSETTGASCGCTPLRERTAGQYGAGSGPRRTRFLAERGPAAGLALTPQTELYSPSTKFQPGIFPVQARFPSFSRCRLLLASPQIKTRGGLALGNHELQRLKGTSFPIRGKGSWTRAFLSADYVVYHNSEIAQTIEGLLAKGDVAVKDFVLEETNMFLKIVSNEIWDVESGLKAGIMIGNSEVGMGSVSVEPLFSESHAPMI
jgi:hypothetical protein